MSRVIDCDAHVLEPADLWQRYLEPEFRDRAIRIEETDGVEKLIIGEEVILQGVVAGLGGAEDSKVELFSGRRSYVRDNPLDSYDPAARLTRMDEWGIEKSVLFPTIGILPFPTEDQALANAYCRAYNNWIREFAETNPSRLAGIWANRSFRRAFVPESTKIMLQPMKMRNPVVNTIAAVVRLGRGRNSNPSVFQSARATYQSA